MGVGSEGPRKRKALASIFRKEKIYKKNCGVSFEVCKKWHCRFFEASDLPQDESVRV